MSGCSVLAQQQWCRAMLQKFPWDHQTNEVLQPAHGQPIDALTQVPRRAPAAKRQRASPRQPEERYRAALDVLHGTWDSHVDMATRASTLTNSDIQLVSPPLVESSMAVDWLHMRTCFAALAEEHATPWSSAGVEGPRHCRHKQAYKAGAHLLDRCHGRFVNAACQCQKAPNIRCSDIQHDVSC